MNFELDQKIIRRLERGDDPEGIAQVFKVSVEYVQAFIKPKKKARKK